MALTDLTRISTSGIATGTSLSGAILHGDAHFRGTQVGVNSAMFDSSENELNFKDNVELTFGNKSGGDLILKHDGNHNRITSTNGFLAIANTADLVSIDGANRIDISDNFIRLRSRDGSDVYMTGTVNSGVDLYHNNDLRFSTTGYGATVFGTLNFNSGGGVSAGVVTCTGLDLNGNGDVSGNLVLGGNLTVNGTTTTLDTNLIGVDRVEVGANSNTVVGVAITQSGSADIVNLFDGATKVVTVDDTGKVGIGTDNPTTLIDVLKTSNNALIKVRCTTAGAYFEADSASSGYSGLKLSSSGTQRWLIGSYATNNFTIKDGSSSSGAERFTIVDGTGNVGINETTPEAKLELDGRFRILDNSQGTPSTGKGLEISYYTSDDMADILSYDRGGGSYKKLQLRGSSIELKKNNTVLCNVGTGGNGVTVGFSTTLNLVTSAEKLAVRGYSSFKSTSASYAAIYTNNELNNTGVLTPHILFNNNGANRGGFGYHTDNNSLIMANHTNIIFKTGATQLAGTERFRIANDGTTSFYSPAVAWHEGPAVLEASNGYGAIFFRSTGSTHGTSITGTWSIGKLAGADGFAVLKNGMTGGGAVRQDAPINISNAGDTKIGKYLAIGHNNPATRLDVKQNNGVAYNNRAQSVAYGAARFFNESGHQSGGTYTGFQFNLTGDSQNRICSIGMISEANNSRASSLVFATDDGGNRTEKLRIHSGGLVEANSSFGATYSTTTSISPHLRARNQQGADNIYGGIQLRADRNNGAASIFNIACLNSSTNFASTLVFQSRNTDGNFSEKLRIDPTGHVRLPINGQQLTWGASQQMKFYYESSEDRMYLQGDGEYGFAFRVNSGNALEIQKTTRDVIMQGASGRNFQWDNSEPSLYLTDNGTNSARLKIGTGGDLQLYHDVSGTVNHIVAATNGTIKISGETEFFDYTGVTKRAVVGSQGLRVGAVAAPTLPTSGKQPMIMRNVTYFTKEIHRTISDYRNLCDGAHSGYLLLIPAHPGSGTVSAKKFYGTIICDRGGTGSGNSTQVATVHAATAYSNDQFYVENARNSQYIVSPAKVTYSGTQYLALKFEQSGGGPHNGIHIDGQYHNVDSNFLRIVRTNEVDSVQNDNHGAIANHNAQYPICGVMVVDMDGTDLNNNSIRYMRGGTTHFEYSPAGTTCYNNGIFTARVNGIYHVTAGVLTGNNVSRVEFSIQRKVTGGSFQNVVNFNGAADFSNSHNGPTATAFIKMKAGWELRVYRVSSNQGAYGAAHANNYFGAVLMHGLMDSQV